ncbi:MAG: four helix bundle protein [Bacteroidota bacterium]
MKHNFKNLEIWKRSRKLVKKVYIITRQLPKEELFVLTAQIRKSVVSMPSNVAEGCGRGTDKQLAHFLDIAIGSNCELETQIYLCYDLTYINKEQQDTLVKELSEIRRMMLSFRNGLSV